jgi:flagellar biosynthesis GTPase FlhF
MTDNEILQKFNTGLISPLSAISNLSGMASDYPYPDTNTKEENKTLEKYELAKEIKEKAKKFIEYAERNNLNVQDTLEAFFSEEELELYENFFSIKNEAEKIIQKRKKEELEKEELDKMYQRLIKKKTFDNTQKTTGFPSNYPKNDSTAGGFDKNIVPWNETQITLSSVKKETFNSHLI